MAKINTQKHDKENKKVVVEKPQVKRRFRYKDDKMTEFESDIDKIRNRPLMYVGLLGSSGANHVCHEMINNHIDECSKPASVTPGNEIWITLDEKNDCIITSDNGRGINPNELVKIYTTLNMGSNMTREHGYTLGENGVGTLCITAFAREAVIQSYRNLHEKTVNTYTFQEGKLVDEKHEPCKDKHGLVVSYKPSRKVFGKDTRIDVDSLLEWIRSFQYRLSPKVKIHVEALRSNGDVIKEDIKSVPFRNIIQDHNTDLMFGTEGFSFDGEMDEEFGGTIQNRTFHCDVAFGYTQDDVPYISSFCNGAHTTDQGSHLDGVINGITKYLKEITNNSMNDKEKEKTVIQNADITNGLSVSVNVMTDMMRLFVSQIKTKVDNPKLAKVLSNLVYEQLSKMRVNWKPYTDMIKLNAKARIEANIIRQKTIKDFGGKWDRYSIANLLPCASLDKTKTELYICEGLSAKGSLRIARDPTYQAIYCIRGFPLNPYGKALSQILANDVYKNLIAIMGCGIGDSFNISKLKYSKIIIATDADLDGFGIRSLLASFFILFYPDIVDQGMVYFADPPLYKIDYKPQEYVTTKKIYLDICEDIYNRKLEQVVPSKDGGWIVLKDSTLFRNAVEFDRNMRLTDIYRIHKDVIFEIVKQFALYLDKNKIDPNMDRKQFEHVVKDISFTFTDKFHEIYYEKDDGYLVFAGVYELNYMGLDFTYATYNRIVPLIQTCMRMKIWDKIYIRDKKSREVLTGIAEDPVKVIQHVMMYMPKIKDRMKGLGQTEKEILSRTTLNPETRTLIQLDLNHDFQSAMEIIKCLRGNSMDDLKSRKMMVRNYDIDIDDIDT